MAGVDAESLPVDCFTTHSEEETISAGWRLGQHLKENGIVCFFGDLGAGKTCFIKGIVSALTQTPCTVNSPTFVYLNIYEGKTAVYHFDLYRLCDAHAFLTMGFDEYLFAGGICCIEWSERIASILPKNCTYVEIKHKGEKEREIVIRHARERNENIKL